MLVVLVHTVPATKTCWLSNRRTAVVLQNSSLKNRHTVSIITVRTVGTGAMYLIVLAHKFDAV